MKYTYCIYLIVFLFLMPSEGRAEDMIKKGEVLNLERCIEIALKMQPTIMAAANTVNATESRVGQAKSNYYPQIDWSSSYDRINAVSGSTNGSFGQNERNI